MTILDLVVQCIGRKYSGCLDSILEFFCDCCIVILCIDPLDVSAIFFKSNFDSFLLNSTDPAGLTSIENTSSNTTWLSSRNCIVTNMFPSSAADGIPENVTSKLSNNNQFGSLSLPASDTYRINTSNM